MRSLLLMTQETLKEELQVLTITAYVVLGVLAAFAVLSLFAAIWKLVVVHRYTKYNRQKVDANLTGSEAAKKLLEGLGINDVQVAQCGFFASIFLGNSYSPRKKLIRLRKNIYNKSTLTAIALAAQKVAIAERDREGDKKIRVRAFLMKLGYFAPFAVLPLFLIGVLIDFFAYQQFGIFTIVFSAIALVYYLASFIVLILNIPIEKCANKKAIEYFEKTNLLSAKEIEDAKDLYKSYITMYVLDFITELLYLIWRLAKFIWQAATFASKNKK